MKGFPKNGLSLKRGIYSTPPRQKGDGRSTLPGRSTRKRESSFALGLSRGTQAVSLTRPLTV